MVKLQKCRDKLLMPKSEASKSRKAIYMAKYQKDNRDIVKRANDKYYEKNSDTVNQRIAKKRNENPEAYKKYTKQYQLDNLPKFAQISAKRRAAKLQRTPKWLSNLQLQQIQIFYDAAASLTKELGIKFEVDHIVPLQGELVSGLHVPWNLQVLTKTENLSKSNKESRTIGSATHDRRLS